MKSTERADLPSKVWVLASVEDIIEINIRLETQSADCVIRSLGLQPVGLDTTG